MDITMEQVEKVRASTGATYEEARAALEECRGSVLDAVLLLEQRGAETGGETENGGSEDHSAGEPQPEAPEREPVGPRARHVIKSLFSNCLRVTLDVWKEDRRTCRVPFLAAVILLVLRWWIVGLVFLLGLCTGYRVHIAGPGTEGWGEKFDRGMDRAAETVHDAVSSMRRQRKKTGQGG